MVHVPVDRAWRQGLGSLLLVLSFIAILTGAIDGSPLLRAALWGLLVLGAFAGVGELCALAAPGQGDDRPDLGLRIAWGMCLSLSIGGALCLAEVAKRPVLIIFVGLSNLLFLVGLLVRQRRGERPPEPTAPASPWVRIAFALLFFIVVLRYLAAIGDRYFNPNDDLVAYFPFVKQILEQGSLIDPFSTRRVMAFGGQAFLHALVAAVTSKFQLHLLDRGIALVAIVLLVVGQARRRRTSPALLALALLILLGLPNTRMNTQSQLTGVVVFFGLYRTLEWFSDRPPRPWMGGALIGMQAAAALALRSNYTAGVLPMIGMSYLFALWAARRVAWRPVLREGLFAAGGILLFILPWSLLSYRSSGTLLFPVMKGFYRSDFYMLQAAESVSVELAFFWDNLRYNRPIELVFVFLLAGFLLPGGGPRRSLHSLLIGAIIGFAAIVHTFVTSDVPGIARYYEAFTISAVMAIFTSRCLPWERTDTRPTVWQRTAAFACLLVALFQLHRHTGEMIASSARTLETLPHDLYAPPTSRSVGVAKRHYLGLQHAVPAGARMLVMVDFPFLFDYARNPIWNVDTGAAVSLPPGIPFFKGPEAFADYLIGQSIRYVAVVLPERAVHLFRRDVWERHRRSGPLIYREQSRFFFDLMDNFEKLRATRAHLYDDGTLYLLDLAATETTLLDPGGRSGR